MDERTRREVDEILQRVLSHPEHERERVLEEACAGAPELEPHVRRLLAAAVDDDDFLKPGGAQEGTSWRGLLSELVADVPVRLRQRVGPYTVEELLGRGGMGVVYRARRTDQPDSGPVALKLLTSLHGDADVARRFELETHILSSLEHPCIARPVDAGLTDDGRPYLAMEHVDGQPIDRFCDAHRLTVSERVRLLIEVARAVAHAHRRMVIHRDLKPGNILVTAEGRPKLLDFGIAKLLDPVGGPIGGPLTRTGLAVMTPEYASPEQIRSETITTATDVYQLGILLYELLTGTRPHRLIGGGRAQLERAVCEQDAPAPSTAIRRWGADPGDGDTGLPPLDTVCRARSTRPDRLRAALRGDLDTIVLKALRKEPERRYASVDQLVDDLERHLAGRPISARRDAIGHRIRAFARRHRLALAASAAILLLTAGVVGLYAERVLAEHERSLREADHAARVATFLQGMFDVAAPGSVAGETVSARELLDRGTQRINSDLGDQPRLQAALLGIVGEMYRKLGAYDSAAPLLTRSLDLQTDLDGELHADVAEAAMALGRLHVDIGEYDEAEACYRRALRIREELFGEDSSEAARTLRSMADLAVADGRPDEAEPLYDRSLPILEHELGPTDPEVAKAMTGLSALYWSTGDYDRAEPLLNRALEIHEQTSGDDPRELAIVLGDLGQLHAGRGEYDDAERLLRRSHDVLERALGADHPDTAMSLEAIARLLAEQDRLDEAEPLYVQALATLRRAYPGDHPNIGQTLNDLALLHWSRGSYDRAEVLLRQALAVGERTLGADHPDVAAALNSLGALYWSQRRYDDARAAYERALAVVEAAFGPDHPHAAVLLVNIGAVMAVQGQVDRAIPLCERAVDINRRAFGPSHPDLAASQGRLATLYADCGRFDEAEELLRDALEQEVAAFGHSHSRVATTLADLCTVARDQGHYDAAEKLCRDALEVKSEVFGADSLDAAYSRSLLASVDALRGDTDRGEPLLRSVLTRLEGELGPRHPDLVPLLNLLASVRRSQGRTDEAVTLLRRALDIGGGVTSTSDVPQRLDVAESCLGLGALLAASGRRDEAADCWSRALDLVGTDPGQLTLVRQARIRAEALAGLGRTEDARRIVERLNATGYRHPVLRRLTERLGSGAD